MVGDQEDPQPAAETVQLIEAAGGEAVALFGDCADWNTAKQMIDLAIDTFGKLDILINNAGIIRDRMLFNMSEKDWDDVIRVHLKGHAAPSHHACVYWRSLAKAGQPVSGRIINTTSGSGIYGNAGQTNYSAAKAGIVGFTLALAQEMARYGVTVNVIAPGAQTRPEVEITGLPDEVRELMGPEQVSPIVAFLASDEAAHITGRVFNALAGRFDRFEGWQLVDGVFKAAQPWTVAELAEVFDDEVAGSPPPPVHLAMLQMMQPIIEAAQQQRATV
jgi:NAD(P)-dependent dehydrogenase (short-subunit alcohol dehydrogenase family)